MLWEKPTRQELLGGVIHMQHGPIDLVLRAWGAPDETTRATEAAWERFQTLLNELVGELPALREAVNAKGAIRSPVGRRMVAACEPFAPGFITPMAAVAGAVADEIAAVMQASANLDRAYVNDGGDIALVLSPGHSLKLGVMGDFGRGPDPVMSAGLTIEAASSVRGVATSGARGRSFSMGIADSVTVLAATAALADAAATVIANAVDADYPGIVRRKAAALDPDSDLGERLVTVAVPELGPDVVDHALRQGLQAAAIFQARGLIHDAALSLHGRTVILGTTDLIAGGADHGSQGAKDRHLCGNDPA